MPEGAYKFTPLQEVRPNEAFSGLSKEDAHDLTKYVHFAEIKCQAKFEQMARDDSVFRPDFLDPISEDYVKNSWTVHPDVTGAHSNIRSLRWPGYYASHKIGSSRYTSYYIGDGKINEDLPFMI